MKRHSLYFTDPRQVELREEEMPQPAEGEVLVRAVHSAISPGTEMLIYRGEVPKDLPADESISALGGNLAYPLKYGYSMVGEIAAVGKGVDNTWIGRKVFAFNPHETAFDVPLQDIRAIPDDISMEDAAFLPNMETAVNLVMDGQPMLGEQVIVFGQGIVGLLVTALLAAHPLAALITFDLYEKRRAASIKLGAHHSLDPSQSGAMDAVRGLLRASDYPGADLVYELSGNPQALDQAIALAGFDSRVVVGSWYGEKRAPLDLGGRFHRSRIRFISSQVSTVNSALSGRWSKARRFENAWEMLRRIKPSQFITHRFPVTRAADAYALLDREPEQAIQVIFDYS